MKLIVRKPTDEEKAFMERQPTWGCGVSTFDWFYSQEEHALLLEGEVTVEYDGGSARFGAGDYVVFPKGMACVWKVEKPVKKHYDFR